MHKIISAISAVLLAGMLSAQTKLPDIVEFPNGTAIAEMSQFAESYIVAKEAGADISFPTAALTGLANDQILAAYIKSANGVQSIEIIKSDDGGKTWGDIERSESWSSGGKYASLSMFRLERSVLKQREETASNNRSGNILFVGDSSIRVAVTSDGGKEWNELCPVNFAGVYRVTSLAQLRDGRLMALFHDNGPFLESGQAGDEKTKSVILKMYSSDGGVSWTYPEIALKHNLYGLYDGVMMRTKEKRRKNYIMITSQRSTGRSLISSSSDEGHSWSYPVLLPSFIHGDMFAAASHRRNIYIAYRDLCKTFEDGTPNPTYGDLVMWSGTSREITKGKIGGVKVRIYDSPHAPERYAENEHGDIGYVSLLPLSKNRLAIIAHGEWEEGENRYARSFIVDSDIIKKLRRRLK